jgi:hypothetical protein
VLFTSCESGNKIFEQVPEKESGILFSNTIKESGELNILNYEYIYNGGGVGIGDFNGDGWQDVYFSGNLVENKLYLNRGDMHFEDITQTAGVTGNGRWGKGVSVVDINNDGKQDIYVSAAVWKDSTKRRNILYINKGNNQDGIPIFSEESKAYGLDDPSHTQMAAFFDYDNDGDLDVYLLINDLIDNVYPNEFRPIHKDGSWPNTDKLLRNDFDSSKGHAYFTDVSRAAGINIEGYGLGISIADINEDGWKDIYVSNDYLSNNILYINNRDGSFTDKCNSYLKHTSKNAMGNDIADINNDGLPDIVELDMAPEDNYRTKMMMNDINYQTFQNSARFGFMHQYVRNTLQVNRGKRVLEQDTLGDLIFSEIAYHAGVAQTDWSWAPLATDVNNDGWRDLVISNGFPKDLSDLDFISYRTSAYASTPYEEMLKQVPVVQVPNYIFQNKGNLTFDNKTSEWGFDFPTFSAGMAYADLDNDGDQDFIMNNTNMPATIMRNLSSKKTNNTYLQCEFTGLGQNRNGFGSIVKIFYRNKMQVYEHNTFRGYMSTVSPVAHFGLDTVSLIDSLAVYWPGNKKQVILNVRANQKINLNEANAKPISKPALPVLAQNNWFTNLTSYSSITLWHNEMDFIDFNIQKLLPHKLTQYGPAISVADINADGLDDVAVGAGSPYWSQVFLQQTDGQFVKKNLVDSSQNFKYQDDGGICLFDADGDNDLDLYIASGGAENGPGFRAYADHFYVNQGNGVFKEDSSAIGPNYTAKSCVKAADYDRDGDLDLFVGGRVLPGSYPSAVSSILYRNDTKNGTIVFTDVTASQAPHLQKIGLVCDALFTDVDNDGWLDLLIAGEWMPVTALRNVNGMFVREGSLSLTKTGWWNSLCAADLDNDGDTDYIAGNFSNNGYIKATQTYPVSVYGKDVDGNQTFDAIISSYQKTSLTDASFQEFVVAGRDEFIREMSTMKGRFPNYSSYAATPMSQVFSNEQLTDILIMKATQLNSVWLENRGSFQFDVHELPQEAQWAPIYGILAEDFNADGNVDIMINGNEYSMAPYLGRYDASNGLVLKGDGKGGFKPLTIVESGIFIPGNGKALAWLNYDGRMSAIAAQNAGSLKLFVSKIQQGHLINVLPTDQYALIHLKNGKTRKQEFNYGSSFFSQSGRYVYQNPTVKRIEIFDRNNKKRMVTAR